jgi:hypothetical protein
MVGAAAMRRAEKFQKKISFSISFARRARKRNG